MADVCWPWRYPNRLFKVTFEVDRYRLLFYIIIMNTSAVSSINLGSIFIFASCVIHRPLVITDVLSFEYIYGSHGCCQGGHHQQFFYLSKVVICCDSCIYQLVCGVIFLCFIIF